MAQKDIIAFLFERMSALNIYWNLLIAIALGIVGLMASGKSFASTWKMKLLATIIFVAFALSNLLAILRINDQRSVLSAMLPLDNPLVPHVRPPAAVGVILFHVVVDVIVVIALWWIDWRQAAQTDD